MDFFDAQDHARRLSHRLIILFGLAVVSMVAIVYVVVAVILGFVPIQEFAGMDGGPGTPSGDFLQLDLLLVVALGMGAVIGGGTMFRTAQLRKGGTAVAELLGGRRVDPATGDPQERVLVNVVEEMSIASGVPVPAIYVMDREPGINAFAAGHSVDDAAVAVTRGALEGLTRDELQGVMAHEFSHILNGDMRLNVRLMGLLFGILLLAVVGRGLLRGAMWGGRGRSSGGGRGSGAQIAALGAVLILMGYLGVVFGRLIQAAVSRQREFLADAAAVQFTRNPDGIAGALKRIGVASGAGGGRAVEGGGAGSLLQDHHAQEAGHLFFADGVGKALSRLTATHPPLPDRIRRIDPRWDGSWNVPPVRKAVEGHGAHAGKEREGGPSPESRPATPGRSRGIPGVPVASLAAASGALTASAGAPGAHHVEYARELLTRIPEGLREALRTEEGAVHAVLALLLSDDDGIRKRQAERVEERLGKGTARAALELRPQVGSLGPAGRLPVLELAAPRLRDLPRERAAALRGLVGEMIRADGTVRTFDFALFHVLQRSLPRPGERSAARATPRIPLSRLRGEAELILSALARAASGPEEAARRALEQGTAGLPPELGPWTLQAKEALTLERVDQALSRMEMSAPAARRMLLQAAAAIVQADGEVEVEEAELFRAVAEALDVPVPPLPASSS